MSRSLEIRLAKVEGAIAPKRRTHEDHLATLDTLPPLTEAEALALDAEIAAEAIAGHGSLPAAAQAARQQASRTRDPMDDLIAADLEYRVGMENRHAHA